MNNNKISPAVWFIPLIAVMLACLCTLFFIVGKHIYKGTLSQATVEEKKPVAAPIVALPVPEEEPEPVLPAEVEEEEPVAEQSPVPEVCPSTAVPVKFTKPKRTRPAAPYEKGLRACVKDGIYPCAWEDNSYGLIEAGWQEGPEGKPDWTRRLAMVNKQFWLMSAQGPIRRGSYDTKTGELISETIATVQGTVTQFTLGNTVWYFEGGVLVKIRTSPYDNCNFHDWFFINEEGKQDVCQCVYNQSACCSRSPYKEGMPRSFCELFARQDEFCSK